MGFRLRFGHHFWIIVVHGRKAKKVFGCGATCEYPSPHRHTDCKDRKPASKLSSALFLCLDLDD